MFACRVESAIEGARGDLLGGSWYLLTSYNCTYNPISPLSALNIMVNYSYNSYSYNCLISTMNLQVEGLAHLEISGMFRGGVWGLRFGV